MEKYPPSRPPGAGKSSFDLIDSERLFEFLKLTAGITLLDMACGPGAYSLAIAERTGTGSLIIAADLWEEGISRLKDDISARGIENIRPIVADITRQISEIGDDSVDICLMVTALHDLVEAGNSEGALKEAARVLRPQGQLVIIEFVKAAGPPGPPLEIRLSADEVESLVVPFGFKKESSAEVGPYNYLLTFESTDTGG